MANDCGSDGFSGDLPGGMRKNAGTESDGGTENHALDEGDGISAGRLIVLQTR
jgi:hypothetical protein